MSPAPPRIAAVLPVYNAAAFAPELFYRLHRNADGLGVADAMAFWRSPLRGRHGPRVGDAAGLLARPARQSIGRVGRPILQPVRRVGRRIPERS